MSWQMPRESDYTAPRPDCPHPEYWEVENNMAAERTVAELVAAFVRAAQPEFVVEIGSHYGQTAELIGRAIRANGHGEFVSLEIDKGMYESATNRCLDVPEATIINIDSLLYIPPKPIDVLFVDGQLKRVLDIEHFLPYLSPGAIILIHDMAISGYGEQLSRIFELCGPDHVMVNSPRGLLIVRNK